MPSPRKLTNRQATNIRNSTENTCQLAKKYGVSPALIWKIRQRETYRDAR